MTRALSLAFAFVGGVALASAVLATHARSWERAALVGLAALSVLRAWREVNRS